MHFSIFLALLSAASGLVAADLLKPRNYDKFDYFTLHLRSGQSPEEVAQALGLRHDGQLGELEDHHMFSAEKGTHEAHTTLTDLKLKVRKREPVPESLESILWSTRSQLKPNHVKRAIIPPRADPYLPGTDTPPPTNNVALVKQQDVMTKLGIQDPIFNEQWHLFNTIQTGHDINVTGVWLEGNTGRNVTVAIVDDGLDMYSDDLKDNYFAEGSYDFNDHTEEPRPRLVNDHHGTRCAGEVAAVKNNVCGVGVAWDAKVAGLRILSKSISDEDEAVAINYAFDKNLIYSCSWGPPDNGMAMDAPNVLIKRAIQNGIQKGRNGLGSIFVFAAGNGAAREDNCNFDGYTNSIYSITVGAIDRNGQHPYYSEKCSASLVVTYSSGGGDAIHTTDVGTNNCYNRHGGTSAAAPLGAGIMALVLSVRPDLNWRDLQYLCIETAVPINLDEDWQDTYIGKKYSHTFAYGKLDAYKLVEKAKDWKSVKPQAWFKTPWQFVRHDIPQGEQGLASTFIVTKDMLKEANLERLEHVQVTMDVEHTRRGDLSVELISPKGVVSHLSATRRHDENPAGYDTWTFMSVVHWGEPGDGNWTVIVKDTVVNENIGTFTDWRMTLWGESIDPAKAVPYPMPTEEDEYPPDEPEDSTAPIVATTSISVGPTTTLPAVPSDHIDRPTKQDQPKTTVTAPDSANTASNTASSTSTASATSTSASSFLPSIFPLFPGVSPRTQIWIYGAIAVILIFCIALGVFFCIWRKRRARATRADYEFELVNDEDADGAGEPLSGEGARRKKRGGELYDAFAGESDEEIFSDAEDHEYKDEPEEKTRRRGESPGGELSEKH